MGRSKMTQKVALLYSHENNHCCLILRTFGVLPEHANVLGEEVPAYFQHFRIAHEAVQEIARLVSQFLRRRVAGGGR